MGNRNACALCARCYDVEFCEECYDGDMFEPYVAPCRKCGIRPTFTMNRNSVWTISHSCVDGRIFTFDKLGVALHGWNDEQEYDEDRDNRPVPAL